jgi:hypothetical protein
VVFRQAIAAALAEGVLADDLTLRLTLTDASKFKRDRTLALDDISFAGGRMRFLGVTVEEGGVTASELVRRGDAAQA